MVWTQNQDRQTEDYGQDTKFCELQLLTQFESSVTLTLKVGGKVLCVTPLHAIGTCIK